MHEHIFIVSWYAACATSEQFNYLMHSKWIEKNSKQHIITLSQEILGHFNFVSFKQFWNFVGILIS